MFETSSSAATLTIQDQDAGTNHPAVRETSAVPAPRTALGGNYVAAFGRPESSAQHAPGVRAAGGFGYTARFDGAVRRSPGAPVDSYTAAFGPAGSAVSAVSGECGRYTDVNL